MFHLPDLPNVGYATDREKRLSDQIQEFMRQTERNRGLLLSIVCEGLPKWRRVAKDAFGLKVEDESLDAIFHYFELQACPPAFQVRLLQAQREPVLWRAVMREAMPDIERQQERVKLLKKWGVS